MTTTDGGVLDRARSVEGQADAANIARKLVDNLEAWASQMQSCERARLVQSAAKAAYDEKFGKFKPARLSPEDRQATEELLQELGEEVIRAKRYIRNEDGVLEGVGLILADKLASEMKLNGVEQELSIADRTYAVEQNVLVLKTVQGEEVHSPNGEAIVFASNEWISAVYGAYSRYSKAKSDDWLLLVEGLALASEA